MFNLKKELEKYLVSAHPLLVANTFEETLVRDALVKIHEDTEHAILVWNAVEGLTFMSVGNGVPTVDKKTYEALCTVYKKVLGQSPTVLPDAELARLPETIRDGMKMAKTVFDISTLEELLVFTEGLGKVNVGMKDRKGNDVLGVPRVTILALDAHLMVDPKDFLTIRRFKTVSVWNRQGHRSLILCTPQWELPVELKREFVEIEVPLPDKEQLGRKLIRLCRENHLNIGQINTGAIIEAGMAMTEMQFENALALSFIHNKRKTITANVVREEGDLVINRQKGLQVLKERTRPEDYIGHERFVEDMVQAAAAFTPEGQAFNLTRPRGVVLVGPPGNGKTYSGGLLASIFEARYLRFDIAACKGRYVGDSGGNARAAIKIIAASGRTLVLNDEVEKTLGGAHETGSANTVGDILDEYLYQLNSGMPDAIVLMTCNRPDKLPPELLRRLDAIYYLGLPTFEQRTNILKVHLKKNGEDPEAIACEEIASKTAGYSAYEIEKMVKRAKRLAFSDNPSNPKLYLKHLTLAKTFIRPISEVNPEDTQRIHRWAAENAIPASADTDENNERASMLESLASAPSSRALN